MNKKKLSPWEKIIIKRVRELIDTRCEGSQKKFVDKTGLNKGSVSQYVNGKNIPSWENAEKIAAAFNIDVEWVMAVDTIPDGIDPQIPQEIIDFYYQYQNLSPEIREAVDLLIKSQQPKS